MKNYIIIGVLHAKIACYLYRTKVIDFLCYDKHGNLYYHDIFIDHKWLLDKVIKV